MNPEAIKGVSESLSLELIELKHKLLSGRATPSEFLAEVLAYDQASPERLGSLGNVSLLEQKDIVHLFDSLPEREEFYNMRSLSYVHRAQMRTIKNDGGVLEDFTFALQDAEKAGEEYSDWANYVKATVLYLQNDAQALKEFLKTADSDFDGNILLVQNLLRGLEERGHPNYMEDCARPRD